MINEADFLKILNEILRANNYNVILQPTSNSAKYSRCDLALINNKKITTVIEVKMYRSDIVSNSLILNAINQVVSYKSAYNAEKGILIIPINLSLDEIEKIISEYGIIIWDQSILFQLASINKNLYEDLKIMFIEAGLSIKVGLDKEEKKKIENILGKEFLQKKSKSKIQHHEGRKIIESLKKIPSGKEREKGNKELNSRRFEIECINALKYLFNDHLTGWKDQETTEDDLNRFDLICKINSKHNFWTSLIEDFKSRYVLFEFKNYNNKIKQEQILTTEKYLFATALRTVAFIIAKNGANNSAFKTTYGTLRESGKLIIIININELINMINMKDNGDDPSSILSEKLDELLMTLSK